MKYTNITGGEKEIQKSDYFQPKHSASSNIASLPPYQTMI